MKRNDTTLGYDDGNEGSLGRPRPVRRDRDRGRGAGGGRRLVRRVRELKGLLRGIDVGARYPQLPEDPGYLEDARAVTASDCARALGNGSLDESSVGMFATTMVGASLARTRAELDLQAARSEEALHALGAAEAKQLTYLRAVRARYGR